MSEIAKCPLCWNDPTIYPTHDKTDPWPGATECCGAAFQTVKAWNQYAAAMELAKAEAAKAICSSKENPIEMGEAIKILEAIEVKKLHAIEVFNG